MLRPAARGRSGWPFRTFAFVIAMAAVALVACAGSARALPEDTWVVAIGNNQGAFTDVKLLYAARDAGEFAEVLRTEGGVSSGRVRTLLDEDAETVRAAILDVNAAIRARLVDGPRATALVIFYSGHADAEALHLNGTRLSLQELRSLAQGSAASLRLLVVDACRSGAITRVKGLHGAPEFVVQLDNHVESEGVAIISSSAAGESSQEADRLRASFFSHHLVSGMRGAADRDGDGRVTLGEAYAYAYAQTVHASAETMALQHPTYAYDVRGRSEVILTTPGARGRRTGRIRLGAPDTYVITEEKEGGPVIAEVSPARARTLLALPEGRYFVQQREARVYREYTFRLAADGEVDLAAQPSRSVRYDQLVRKRGGARESVHGLSLLAGAEGGILDGEGAMPNIVLGYAADLPWLTAGVRVRGSTLSLLSVDNGLPSRHYELGLGLLLQRTVDLPWLSVGLGLTIEAIYHGQRFESATRPVTPRNVFGPGFGILLAVERRLLGGLAFRIEGGPVALLERSGTIKSGVETGAVLTSTFTYWAAGGFVWRL